MPGAYTNSNANTELLPNDLPPAQRKRAPFASALAASDDQFALHDKTRKDLQSADTQTQMSILDQPGEIIDNIICLKPITDDRLTRSSERSLRVMAALAKANRGFSRFFKPMLQEKKKAIPTLLEYVLLPTAINIEKIKEVARSQPELFFCKAAATDHAKILSGQPRIIENWSPYQAMFGNGDTDLLAQLKPFLDDYLLTLKNSDGTSFGAEFAVKQIKEKFPNGFDFPASTFDFKPLVAAIAADRDLEDRNTANFATNNLVAQFRKAFQPGVVTQGHHFNMNDMLKAYAIHEENWLRWNSNQITFFSIKVIGLLEGLMAGPYLQAACHGLESHIKERQPLRRDFTVFAISNHSWVGLRPDSEPLYRLAEHFVIDHHNGGVFDSKSGVAHGKTTLEDYCETKISSMQKLMPHAAERARMCPN